MVDGVFLCALFNANNEKFWNEINQRNFARIAKILHEMRNFSFSQIQPTYLRPRSLYTLSNLGTHYWRPFCVCLGEDKETWLTLTLVPTYDTPQKTFWCPQKTGTYRNVSQKYLFCSIQSYQSNKKTSVKKCSVFVEKFEILWNSFFRRVAKRQKSRCLVYCV